MTIEISKSQFKSRALEFFRDVEATGESIIITDHGRPTIEIRPLKDSSPLDILKNSVIKYDDPTLPIADDEWENA